MGDRSRIEWTDATWNPVTGCSKVSEGCRHCYAERFFPRTAAGQTVRMKTPGCTRPREFTDVRCHEDRLDQPLRWKRPRLVFVNSMSDLFHNDVPDAFIRRVFDVMGEAKRHTFQVLTKRAERMADFMRRRTPADNVWLGVSVEDQETAASRIYQLLRCRSVVRWISAEPLLGPIDLGRLLVSVGDVTQQLDALRGEVVQGGLGYPTPTLDWVVVGGESGPAARVTEVEWVTDLRDQCLAFAVPFFFKQWGQWVREDQAPRDGVQFSRCETRRDGVYLRTTKKEAGAHLDKRRHEDIPTPF